MLPRIGLLFGILLIATCGARAVRAQSPTPSADVFMQFGAHPDDDLLFLNPDIQNVIGAGYGSVTVMLTAAEAQGGLDGTSRAVFAGQRQAGLRAAYAAMAGATDSWTRTPTWIADHWVEVDELNAAPRVKLVFLNLPDGGDSSATVTPNTLLSLSEDPLRAASTFIPYQSVVPVPFYYTHDSLIRTLVALLDLYQPTNIRTLDPMPVLTCAGYDLQGNCSAWLHDDNPDHKSVARFVDEALAQYDGPGHRRSYSTAYYQGLATAEHRGNLSPTNYTRKRGICDVYKAYDVNFRIFENNYAGEFGANWERFAAGTTWLQPQADGRLAAFAVQGRQVVYWKELAVGGDWSGTVRLGGGPISPHIDVVRYADGRLRVFALQGPWQGEREFPAAGDWPRIVTAVQVVPDGPFGAWEDLGGPNPLGVPTAIVDGQDLAEVFVRNETGGISRKVETGTGWAAWEVLTIGSADDVVDAIAAIRNGTGLVELFAAYRSGAMAHMKQLVSGGYLIDPGFPAVNVAGPPTVTRNSDGRPEIFYHEAGTANVRTAFFTPSGVWSTNLVDLGGDGGHGPVAAMLRTASGQIMLFARNNYGGVSTLWQGSPNGSFIGTWQDLGGELPAFPAAANDAAGRVVMAMVGTDGRLYIRREVTVGVIGFFGPWTSVGGGMADVDPPPSPVLMLAPNWPNPFNPSTTIRYTVARTGPVRLEVFDVLGRIVARLVDRVDPAGDHTVVWDARIGAGAELPSGVYLARLQADGATRVRKMVLLR